MIILIFFQFIEIFPNFIQNDAIFPNFKGPGPIPKIPRDGPDKLQGEEGRDLTQSC